MSSSSSSSSMDSSSSSFIYSSSSSSSSSIDSSSSSSSSSNDLFYSKINFAVINQSNGNLLPFSFIGEQGYNRDLGDGSEFAWTISSSQSPNIDYDAIINRDTSGITTSNSND